MEFSISIKDDGSIEILENESGHQLSNKRISKGKSSTVILNNYTIVDIETTGFDTQFDEIIELSAIKISNNKKQDTFHTLVHPTQEIDEFIISHTGITNQMLEPAPTIETVLPSFIDFIGNDVVVGHNVNFDINFIYDYCVDILEKPFINDFVDTMRLTRKLFPESPNHKLITLANFLNLAKIPNHRAEADCEAVLELYQLIAQYVEKNNFNLQELFKRHNKNHHSPASHVTTTKSEFNEDHPFFRKTCVFTGALEKMQRKDAMQIVADLGGCCSDSVTKKTNYLILGNLDYCKTIKDGKSSKLKKAQSLILSGHDLEIISENIFYSLISIG
ncbi:MAG: exonuclease domain-containing protein [Veillonellales bacterium]